MIRTPEPIAFHFHRAEQTLCPVSWFWDTTSEIRDKRINQRDHVKVGSLIRAGFRKSS